MANEKPYVRIFDTTLRDGEQSPGATMTSAEKLQVAHALARLGVDIIEAGFPAASPDDWEAVHKIAETVGRGVEGRTPSICGLARASKNDISRAAEAVKPAAKPRIHTFLATSPIHMEHKLRMTPEQVKARVAEMVAYARSLCEDIEFSPEDAGRSDIDFLIEVLGIAVANGATTLNIPDTVGYVTPAEYGALIARLKRDVPGADKVIFSCHCHDDLGLATANALAGVMNGARQIEVAVNGIGERAGNTSLEEVVMAMGTRADFFGMRHGIDTTQIMRVSKLVTSCTGIAVQPNKAIVGANAFAHEAGIHQDGMLKNASTYEIMRPESVGAVVTKLVLGKHSGRAAVKSRLAELGYALVDNDLDKAFARFKALADRKKTVTDADLVALVADELYQPVERYALVALDVKCGTAGPSSATVRLKGPEDGELAMTATGTGPVDAVFRAIDSLLQVSCTLLEYSVQAVTEGIDALGEVSVKVESAQVAPENPQHATSGKRVYHGHGAETDIVVASAKAYLSALNRIIAATEASKSEEVAEAAS